MATLRWSPPLGRFLRWIPTDSIHIETNAHYFSPCLWDPLRIVVDFGSRLIWKLIWSQKISSHNLSQTYHQTAVKILLPVFRITFPGYRVQNLLCFWLGIENASMYYQVQNILVVLLSPSPSVVEDNLPQVIWLIVRTQWQFGFIITSNIEDIGSWLRRLQWDEYINENNDIQFYKVPHPTGLVHIIQHVVNHLPWNRLSIALRNYHQYFPASPKLAFY